MALSLIWAQSTSGVIGRAGGIPWRLPEDQVRFKELTLGHTVVMGRLTWESLPAKVRPLPGRRNVVVSRHAGYMADGAGEVVTALTDAPLGDDRAWITVAVRSMPRALPLATRCEVTEIEIDLRREDSDALAPVLDESWQGTVGDWQDSTAGPRYRFHTYLRRMTRLSTAAGTSCRGGGSRISRASNPLGLVSRAHLKRLIARIQVLQLDSVSVAVRAHDAPIFSRLGPL